MYLIYGRPHLQSFLTKLFANYRVAVWTAAGFEYAMYVTKHFIVRDKKERALEFIMWDDHCEVSSESSDGQAKDLRILANLPDLRQSMMVLLDDNEDILAQAETRRTGVIDSHDFSILQPDAKSDRFLHTVWQEIEQKL